MLSWFLTKQLKCTQVIPGTTSLLVFFFVVLFMMQQEKGADKRSCWLVDCVIELLILRKLQSYSPTDSHPLPRACCLLFASRRSKEEHRNQVSFFNLVLFVCLFVTRFIYSFRESQNEVIMALMVPTPCDSKCFSYLSKHGNQCLHVFLMYLLLSGTSHYTNDGVIYIIVHLGLPP